MTEDRSWCIYKHTNNINNKVYIGLTCDLKGRWDNGNGYLHMRDGKYLQPAIANAILKYGWENFSHEILERNLTKDEADELEERYIAEYDARNPEKGYNIRLGGSNGKLSEETKEKLRQTMLGRYDGEKNPFYGKHHTEEAKQKLRESGKKNARDINGEKNPMYIFRQKYGKDAKPQHAKDRPERTKEYVEKMKRIAKENAAKNKESRVAVHRTEEQKIHIKESFQKRREELKKQGMDKFGLAPYIYICVETGQEFNSMREIEEEMDISRASISNIFNGKQKTAGGFHWQRHFKE